MHWFKHYTTSMDDPDVQEAEDLFGDAGYAVFFKLLEVYGKEYNQVDAEGWLLISRKILRRKLGKSWRKVEQILSFYQTKSRIFFKTKNSHVLINIPKFIERASNWTKRKRGKPTEGPQEAPTAKEGEENVKNNIHRVWEHWKQTMKRPEAKLTQERKKAIQNRLSERYSVQDILRAINGCKNSPFHMGENQHGAVFNDITNICKDGSKLESFIEKAKKETAPETVSWRRCKHCRKPMIKHEGKIVCGWCDL